MSGISSGRLGSIMGCDNGTANRYGPPINRAMSNYGINTPLRQAHFLGQIGHETGGLKYMTEQCDYDPNNLPDVIAHKFAPGEFARCFAGNPTKIANRAYANVIGNGDEASGDGSRFLGRGMFQLTGRANYEAFQRDSGEPVVSHPERVASDPYLSAAVAGWYWNKNGISGDADRDDLHEVTRKINGGTHGMSSRSQYLQRAKRELGI